MADLNISKSDNSTLHEDVGQNPFTNGDFELAPTFTAATTTGARWIDGSAAGSSTTDTYGWALTGGAGSYATQFDTASPHGGASSLKLSTVAISSFLSVGLAISSSLANLNRYGILVYPNTQYILSGWMKTNYVSGDSTNGACICLLTYDAAAAAKQTIRLPNGYLKTTSGWTFYSTTFTTDAAAVYANFDNRIFGHTGTATLIMDAWFDDLMLQPVSRITGVDLPVGPLITPGVQNITGPKIWG